MTCTHAPFSWVDSTDKTATNWFYQALLRNNVFPLPSLESQLPPHTQWEIIKTRLAQTPVLSYRHIQMTPAEVSEKMRRNYLVHQSRSRHANLKTATFRLSPQALTALKNLVRQQNLTQQRKITQQQMIEALITEGHDFLRREKSLLKESAVRFSNKRLWLIQRERMLDAQAAALRAREKDQTLQTQDVINLENGSVKVAVLQKLLYAAQTAPTYTKEQNDRFRKAALGFLQELNNIECDNSPETEDPT